MKSQVCGELLSKFGIHPVLVDIGASVAPPEIWGPIAPHSIYVGFDPDLRELQNRIGSPFHKAIIVNEAITADPACKEAIFFFTKSPICSSTLLPDSESLSDYLFSDLFLVEREGKVPATTIDSVLTRLALPQVDWLKTDSQGTDLRLFESLNAETRSKVLAVDLEPGLIDAYIGEDLFIDVHKKLLQRGFWLSDLEVQGTVRMRSSTLNRLMVWDSSLSPHSPERAVRKSPGWVNARYLRSLRSLSEGSFNQREYILLWIFAALDKQIGFAADLMFEYEKRFGEDHASRAMRVEVLSQLKQFGRKAPTLLGTVKSILPAPAKRWIKNLIRRKDKG